MRRRLHSGQRGVALITAVLIAALVTAIAVGLATSQQLDIRRSANIFSADQAYLVALGGEDSARALMRKDRQDNSVDHPGEGWGEEFVLPFEGGTITGGVHDEQARFNINNLLTEDGKPSEPDVEIFKRLLRLLEFEQPEALAQATLDWLDADIDPTFPDGAEDDYYMGLDPGYRTANRLMASPSELVLVKGFDDKGYRKLEPYVAALPKRTAINVNSNLAPVLASLMDGLSISDGETLASARPKDGWTKVEDFLGQSLLKGKPINQNGLSVASEYFLLQGVAEYGQSRNVLYSLMQRDDQGNVTILMRGQGAY